MSLPQHHLGIQLIHIAHSHTQHTHIPEHKWMGEAQIENHVNMFCSSVCNVCIRKNYYYYYIMNAKEYGTSKRNFSKALGAPYSA